VPEIPPKDDIADIALTITVAVLHILTSHYWFLFGFHTHLHLSNHMPAFWHGKTVVIPSTCAGTELAKQVQYQLYPLALVYLS